MNTPNFCRVPIPIRVAAMLAVCCGTAASAHARTVMVCNPFNQCERVDTTVIGDRPLTEYRVLRTEPFNVNQRRSILATNPQAASQLCGCDLTTPVPAPIRTLTCEVRIAVTAFTPCQEQAQLIGLGKFLAKCGAQFVQSRDGRTLNALLSTLHAWASAEGFTEYPGWTPGTPGLDDIQLKFLLDYFVGFPLALTWGTLRNDSAVSPADRVLIDNWVDRLLSFSNANHNSLPQPAPNNHGYLHAAVKMMWGIARADDAAFQDGIERYDLALHQMSIDGSLPWEVGRDACSTRYQAIALQWLVTIAELAASQGYDLYSLEVRGQTIHTGIQFLADIIDNPSILDPYKGKATAPCDKPLGSPQDFAGSALPWLEGPAQFGRMNYTYLAFVEYYVGRFPEAPLTGRLRRLPWPSLAATRPLYQEPAGNTSCIASTDGFVQLRISGSQTSFDPPGGTGTLQIATGPGGYQWNAESSADWLVLGQTSGTGHTFISFTVLPNDSPAVRTAIISVGGQIYQVRQQGQTSVF